MSSKFKRSAWFSRRQKSRLPDRKKSRSTVRLSMETLEDRLAPAVAGTAHFAVIGDFGAAGPNEQAVASLVQSWNPNFIVSVGDNNYEFGGADTIDQNIGQYYSNYIYPYKGTYGSTATTNMFWPVLGNHDWETTGAAPYFGYFTLPGNGRYYKLSEGPIDFFMMDSDTHEPDGNGQSNTQGAWLQAQLSLSTAPWKIVVFHHPPYSSGTEGSSSVMQWSFKNMGASAVISGHDHDYERFNINGIPYFVDGTGGAALGGFPGTPIANEVVRDGTDYGAMLVDASASQITYQFINTAGSVIDSYTVTYPLPAAPTNLTATQVSGNQTNLTWTDNATNENGYSIERSTDGTNFTQIAIVAPQTTQYLDSGLAGGVYYYRVTAFNAGGSSAYTNPTNVSMPLFQAPKSGTPSNLSVAAVMFNQLVLSWTDNSGGQNSFSIERSTDGSNYTPIATMAPGTTHYADSSLASANYFYRIRGVDSSGNYSDYTNVVMGALTPAAPSALAATPVSSQQINLNWTDNSNDETGFTISESTDAINFTQLAIVGANITSYPVTGLISTATYYFKVTAFNTGGTADSNSASATTNLAPPANASNLTATAVSSSQINLSWTDNSTVPQEDGFKIYRTTDNPNLVETPNFVWAYTAGQNVTSYSVTGLTPGTPYWFYVKAYNSAGPAGPTNTTGNTTFPLPLAPSNLTATAASAIEIDLSWTNNDPTSQGTKIYKSSDGVNFLWAYTMAQGVTSYAVTGLAQTSTYYFYIASYNANGTSAFTSTVSATTLTLPAAPSNLTATATSSSQINLAWTNNAVNPAASNFAIYQSSDGVNYTWSFTVSASSTSFSVTGLASSTTYYYKVAAASQAGSSGFSNTVSATTQAAPQPPAAPSNLASTVVSATQINLSWTNNDATATGSKVYKSTDGVNYSWAYTMGQGVNSYSVTGLSQSTIYYFKVVAYNSIGNSAFSNAVSATTMAVPAAPSNLAATVANSSQINLSWTNNDGSATGTKIYKSTDGVNFSWSYTMSQGVSSYSVTGLLASTTYYFKVAAYNSAGTSAFSGTVNATTMAVPANPTNLTATATGSSQISLAWTNNAVNPAATNIAIYKSTDGVNFSWSYTVSPTASSFSATGLSASTTYYFRIRTYNANGTSGYTNISSATSSSSTAPTSAPAAPSGLTATGVSSSQINLSWTNNATNQNGFTIQRSLDGTTFTTIATVGAGMTSYSVTGLSASTTYYFQVNAYNPVGTSAFSNAASGTTSAGTSELSGDLASSQVIVAGLGQTVGWSATLGAPATVGVYIDNSDGSMTPAELARIADAVAVLNVTWNGSNGLQLVLVTDPARASIIMHTTSTTPAGGLTDGVLGDTEMSFIADPNAQMDDANPYTVFTGQQMVDIVQGWNWYTGSTQVNTGMTAITSSQYDFESVVLHELGHAVGLYHDTAVYGMLNGDGYSTMYPLLFAGQTHRQVSSHDVAWLKHLYAYGPNPGSNEAPQPDDALRAWLPASAASSPSSTETGAAEALSGTSVASASARLLAPAAPTGRGANIEAPAATFMLFQLGVDSAVPLASQKLEPAGITRVGTHSFVMSSGDARGHIDAHATVFLASTTHPAPNKLDLTSPVLTHEEGIGTPGVAIDGEGRFSPARAGESRSRVSIWDIAPGDNLTGSRLDSGKTDLLSEATPSFWEQPGASEGLHVSMALVLALIPGAASLPAVLLDRSSKARPEEAARFAGDFWRRNRQ